MSTISTEDKKYLDNALRLQQHRGRILRFTEETFTRLFQEQGININKAKYTILGTSKQNRFDRFLEIEDNQTVALVISSLASQFRNKELAGTISVKFSEGLEKIVQTLLIQPHKKSSSISNTDISVSIHPDLYRHIIPYLDREDYFTAVQESYKFVRQKLKSIVGKESATAIFGENATKTDYHIPLFGSQPAKGTPESDSYKGYAYIHLAIQFLRNEQAHSLAKDIDRNLALHFITLASVAYILIYNPKIQSPA